MGQGIMIQDSPEWHAWRSGKIGSSTIASVMGICPYSTPYQAWASITGRSRFEGNHFTEHGKELEPSARARYELQAMLDMPPACATHPKFSMCIASLDGWNEEEKKTSLPKHQLDFMKERVVRMAGHPKVRCGNVQISTVNRNGSFSYHKLTIGSAS